MSLTNLNKLQMYFVAIEFKFNIKSETIFLVFINYYVLDLDFKALFNIFFSYGKFIF